MSNVFHILRKFFAKKSDLPMQVASFEVLLQLDKSNNAGLSSITTSKTGLQDASIAATLTEFVSACVVLRSILFEEFLDEWVLCVLDACAECRFGFLVALHLLEVNEFSHESTASCELLWTVVREFHCHEVALVVLDVLGDFDVILIRSDCECDVFFCEASHGFSAVNRCFDFAVPKKFRNLIFEQSQSLICAFT